LKENYFDEPLNEGGQADEISPDSINDETSELSPKRLK